MGITVKLDTKNLEKFAKLLPSRVAAALNNANQSMESLAQQLAPKETGALAASIHIEKIASASKLEASTVAGNEEVDYAQYIELGFHHFPDGTWIPPQPYMLPAYENARKQLISELSDMGKGIDWITTTSVPAIDGGVLVRGPGGKFVGRRK